MASIFQHFTAFELKLTQIRHRVARNTGAKPLFRYGMFVFLTGKTHFAGVDFKKFRERIGDKTGITAIFQNTHEDVFTLAVRLKT
ncbi:hypothetical protein D3C78_1461290 [compost metagenome]